MKVVKEKSKLDKKELKIKSKKLVDIAKKKGLLKKHTLAFSEYPALDEIHKGKSNFWK